MILISTKRVPKSEQHAHAHSLLGRCLKAVGVDYTEGVTPVVFGEQGKPSLAEYPELHYNISHAEGIAAAMVSDVSCGIDCEPVRPYDPRVMKHTFSEGERRAVENAPEQERALLFFSLWTLKEAYVKALGVGLSYPMREAAFAFDGDRILTDIKGCRFARYVLDGKFVLSTCELKDGEAGRTRFLQASENDIIL